MLRPRQPRWKSLSLFVSWLYRAACARCMCSNRDIGWWCVERSKRNREFSACVPMMIRQSKAMGICERESGRFLLAISQTTAHCYTSVVWSTLRMVVRLLTRLVNVDFVFSSVARVMDTALLKCNSFVIRRLNSMNSMVSRDTLFDTCWSKFVRLDLFQLNRTSYNRVRNWFNHLDAYRRTLIAHQLEGYPACDDLVQGSSKHLLWWQQKEADR